jgi:uncharacterized phage-associated protein
LSRQILHPEGEIGYMSYNALDIAKYIINKCTVENQPISNLQLQKILYYVQREALQSGFEAFEDEMEAWRFGPVVPAVYYVYCGFGASEIVMHYNISIEENLKRIIDHITVSKRSLFPWDLVGDTHKKGKAWDIVYNDGEGNHCVIPKKIIRENG